MFNILLCILWIMTCILKLTKSLSTHGKYTNYANGLCFVLCKLYFSFPLQTLELLIAVTVQYDYGWYLSAVVSVPSPLVCGGGPFSNC